MATMQLVRKKAVHKTEHYTFPTAYLYNYFYLWNFPSKHTVENKYDEYKISEDF